MNFCVPNVGTSIKSSQIESDGHEASNLLCKIRKEVATWTPTKKGFMVDHFVRPPVTLTVELPTCIDISHIIIQPKLGTQSSSAFQIQTETMGKIWKPGDPAVGVKHVVAKEYLPVNGMQDLLMFRNARFVPRPPFALVKPTNSAAVENNCSRFDFKHPLPYAMSSVIRVEITILRTSGSSVPVVGSLEIWGQPCRRCPKEVVDKLLITWLRFNKKSSNASDVPAEATNKTDCNEKTESPVRSTAKRRMCPELLNIPEDFVDPITNEMMCQPVRLPCGIAVDASTLDKYYREEEKWGRQPNDPFTGRVYTDANKPVGDVGLKTRLDQFALQHAMEEPIKKLPRTLGISEKLRGGPWTTSTLVSNSHLHTVETLEVLDLNLPDLVSEPKLDVTTVPGASVDIDLELKKMFSTGNLYLPSAAGSCSEARVSGSTRNNAACKICKTLMEPVSLTFYKPAIAICNHVFICRKCLVCMEKHTVHQCEDCGSEWCASRMERVHFNAVTSKRYH